MLHDSLTLSHRMDSFHVATTIVPLIRSGWYNSHTIFKMSVDLVRNEAGQIVQRFFRQHEWKNLDDIFPFLTPLYTGKVLKTVSRRSLLISLN